MIFGNFFGSDQLAAKRKAVLNEPKWFAPIHTFRSIVSYKDFTSINTFEVKATLSKYHVAEFIVEEFTTLDYINFCAQFGQLSPEDSEAIQDQVDADYILNLDSRYTDTTDSDHKPFSTDFICFHSEASFVPPIERPRYLFFFCHHSPQRDCGGQTILVETKPVLNQLNCKELDLLNNLCYSQNLHNTFLSENNSEIVLSIRDFDQQPLTWTYIGQNKEVLPEDINNTLEKLFTCVYDLKMIAGIDWSLHKVFILDNNFYLHARTKQLSKVKRHLARVCVV